MPDLAVLEGLWVVAPTSGLTFDLTTGRFAAIDVPRLDLRRTLRAVWVGPRVAPVAAARYLLSHITCLGRTE